MARPQKRRRTGSLVDIQRGLYAMFQRHLEFVEAPESDHDTVVKSSNAASQIALAYMRVCELTELETQLHQYEAVTGNGHAG